MVLSADLEASLAVVVVNLSDRFVTATRLVAGLILGRGRCVDCVWP